MVQRRALQIIVGNIPYEEACRLFDLPTLAERRFSLCCSALSGQITSESHVLQYLLPAKRDAQITRYTPVVIDDEISNSSHADKSI